VAVGDEGRDIIGRRVARVGGGALRREEGWKGEEVAGARGAVGDKGEDFGDEALLDACLLRLSKAVSLCLVVGVEMGVRAGCRISSALAGRHC
jgi:hypothetical protein